MLYSNTSMYDGRMPFLASCHLANTYCCCCCKPAGHRLTM